MPLKTGDQRKLARSSQRRNPTDDRLFPIPSFSENSAREADLWDSIALRNSLFSALNPILEKFLSLDRMRELYREVRGPDGSNIFNRILQKMHVTCAVSDTDLARVPATGATVVVANHPAGMNQRGLRGAMEWLRKGGMLLIFPAGEVAHFQWNKGVVDPEWNTTAYHLARSTASATLPIFIDGRNSLPFQFVGFIHPRLRTARLPQEFLQKSGSKIEVRIGKPEKAGDRSQVTGERAQQNLSSGQARRLVDETGIEWLRWKTYVLANRATKSSKNAPKLPPLPFLPAPKPLVHAVSPDVLERELGRLHPSASLESNEEYAVYCANAPEIPQILREIGRLRELTFRAVGEGTGKSVDLDRFDDYYCHLFVWNKANREIVGAYRLTKTAEVLAQYGAEGLYTNTLFRFRPRFFAKLGPALELGRSFVRPEYQRQYAPLLVLWKAIGRYVVLNPENPVLFGAVSISNSYAPASRTLMYQFFQSQFAAHPLSELVQPRHPFRSGRLKHWDINAFHRLVRDSDELSGSISEFEFDGKGIPILLKQYLKVGGQVLAFNVDGRFSDVLDGLIVVDLRHTDRKTLQRYLGAEGSVTFLRHQHATSELVF